MPRTKTHGFPNVETKEGDELQRSESQAHQECLNAPARMGHVLSFFFCGGNLQVHILPCLFFSDHSQQPKDVRLT